MSVCASSEVYTLDGSTLLHTSSPDKDNLPLTQFSSQNVNLKKLQIPLISKRMNKIQQNIRQVTEQAVESSKQKRHRYQLQYQSLQQKYHKVKQKDRARDRTEIKQPNSIFISLVQPKIQSYYLTSSVSNYSDMKHQDSLSRFQTLNQMEEGYVDLKNKIKKDKIRLPTIFIHSHHTFSARKQLADVSQEDIQKSLKNTIIQSNGKKEFKDIHLLKRARDKVSSSLMTVGEYQSGSSVPTYNQLVEQIKGNRRQLLRQRQRAKDRIVRQREVKKGRMMNSRHLNGNVYFNLVSLSRKQRRNLKQHCRFEQNYGIE